MSDRELAADVGHVRALAEHGRKTPLVGGPFPVLVGCALAVAYLLHWLLLSGVLGSPHGLWYAALWLTFLFIATGGWAVQHGRSRDRTGASSMVNQVDRAVWLAIVLAIVAVVAGSVGRGAATGDVKVLNGITAAAFGLYAVGLGAAAVLSGQSWLQIFSFTAIGASTVLWMFGDQLWAFPFAATVSVIVLVVPGLLLIRRQHAGAAQPHA